MKIFNHKVIFSGLLLLLIPLFSNGQSIQKVLNKGEIVILKISPHSDRFTDETWFHSYQIIKSDSLYLVVLTKDNEAFSKSFSQTELKPFIKYIKKWRSKKPKYSGHSQDGIILIIGDMKEAFNASFKSDVNLLDIMYKNNQSNPIKMGVR